MTLSISQMLNAEALERVEETLERCRYTRTKGSEYRAPSDGFPAILQFNGAAAAVPMLLGKSWKANGNYLDDLAQLIRRQGVFSVAAGKDLAQLLTESRGSDYLLLHHQIALAAAWLKRAAALLCSEPDPDAATGSDGANPEPSAEYADAGPK